MGATGRIVGFEPGNPPPRLGITARATLLPEYLDDFGRVGPTMSADGSALDESNRPAI